jgi:hypothetical protein
LRPVRGKESSSLDNAKPAITSSATPIDHAIQLAGPGNTDNKHDDSPTTALGAICATDCVGTSIEDSTPRSRFSRGEGPDIFLAGAAGGFDIPGIPCECVTPLAIGRSQFRHPIAGALVN